MARDCGLGITRSASVMELVVDFAGGYWPAMGKRRGVFLAGNYNTRTTSGISYLVCPHGDDRRLVHTASGTSPTATSDTRRRPPPTDPLRPGPHVEPNKCRGARPPGATSSAWREGACATAAAATGGGRAGMHDGRRTGRTFMRRVATRGASQTVTEPRDPTGERSTPRPAPRGVRLFPASGGKGLRTVLSP